ncbi:YciI family protein [Gallaecimonas sp. GXIMD4217]|uniref:YciI family protein n=1 Tax=Gallaecimonas sp. GXIMD4217 TaxID=3131927 RepID=UPI00311AD994
MRYLIMRKADADTEAGVMPSQELLQAMGQYHQQLAEAGILRDGLGLRPSRDGFRVRFEGGQALVSDGPFAEAGALLAGFTLIEVASRDEALAWARRWPQLDGNGQVELEVRRLFEMEDFAEGEGKQAVAEAFEGRPLNPAAMVPYLSFQGDCRQAFAFYAERLGGEITAMRTFAETPMAAEMPAPMQDKIVHARLRLGQLELMASDAHPDQYQATAGFHVCLQFDEPAELELAFDGLSEGASILMPVAETFWARRFGMLVDRFGIPWMFNCNKTNG